MGAIRGVIVDVRCMIYDGLLSYGAERKEDGSMIIVAPDDGADSRPRCRG